MRSSAGGLDLDATKATLSVPLAPALADGETVNINWQEESHGLAESIPINADVAGRDSEIHPKSPSVKSTRAAVRSLRSQDECWSRTRVPRLWD